MTTNSSLFVCQIRQKDNYTFSIQWSNGETQDFRLSDLQRHCPCANCMDEMTGKSLLDPRTLQEHVRAVVIRSVGRYGLQIQFTSGCSTGIYSFDRLYQLGKSSETISEIKRS